LVLSIETLEGYWRAAAENVPMVIVGAGRWGRVLADVAAGARGSAELVALVARSNPEEARAWQAEAPERRGGLVIAGGLDAALGLLARRAEGQGVSAIIASRPRDHVADARQTLALGLPTLVEKPLSDDPDAGRVLLAEAARWSLPIGLGVEFSLLPGLHFAAARVATEGHVITRLVLEWDDPQNETRHGATKQPHDEVGLLADLLPHALSIGRVFAASADWSVDDAQEGADGHRGFLRLRQGATLTLELAANRAAARRRRQLLLWQGDATIAEVDFTGEPAVRVTGQIAPLPERFAVLTSTLRLELGAFLCDLRDPGSPSPISAGLDIYPRLHAELRSKIFRHHRAR
jgi:predicted dehydrogenase